MLRRRLSLHLRGRYDLGIEHDPIRSHADLLVRYFWARLFQRRPGQDEQRRSAQERAVRIAFLARRLLRKLRLGRIPIRIVFLAGDPVDWGSLQSFFQACRADPAFKVTVLHVGFAGWLGISTDCRAFFAARGIRAIDGIDSPVALDRLNADLFVTSSPYDQFRPAPYAAKELQRYGRLIYITYGADFADRAGRLAKQTFGLEAQRLAWRIFSRSSRTAPQYLAQGGIPARRVVGLGLPLIDLHHEARPEESLPPAVLRASAGKFKILYTPHHSLEGWSTFLRHREAMRSLLGDLPDCYLVFRPHPGLLPRLLHDKVMSEAEFRGFFGEERCYLDESDAYHGLFHWSDLLVSDASSFLVQYASVNKPVIYTLREDGWGGLDDSLRPEVLRGYYLAREPSEIAPLVRQLKAGEDPLAEQRAAAQKRMVHGIHQGGAGQRIAAYIKARLA